MESGPAERFTVEVPDAQLADLRERLARTRWPHDLENEDWRYGANTAYLKELVAYWLDGYDWRRHEAAINGHPNFKASVDGTPIHFIHEQGKGPDPVPLILSHGWPWTFWDFKDVIGPLTDPVAYGGDAEDSFDVVVPSLPGFAYQERGGHFAPSEQPEALVADIREFFRPLRVR